MSELVNALLLDQLQKIRTQEVLLGVGADTSGRGRI
jgi:hypothetical protein